MFLIREEAAIRELVAVTKETRSGGLAEGSHLHIVHLSDSSSSLELIKVLFYMYVVPIGMILDKEDANCHCLYMHPLPNRFTNH